MGVYIRDSKFYWLLLDGFRTPTGRPLREPTKILHDAPTPRLKKDAKEAAIRHYHARMAQLAKGAGEGGKPARTFAEQAEWFTKYLLPRRKGKEREAPLIPKLVAVFGPLAIAAVTRTVVMQHWITPRLTTPTTIAKKKRTAARQVQAGPRTVNREVAVIKAIVQSAVPDYLPDPSPLYGMPLLPTTTPKRRLMTEAEERRLLAVMAVDDKALFLLGLDSLIRLSDLLDVKRADDHKDRVWIGDPKAGGGFEVPISKRARKALDAWYRSPTYSEVSGYIFERRRRAKTERDRRNGIRQMLERACREADVPYGRRIGGITFHWATRRTGATRMLTRGVDPGTAQKIGGWATSNVMLSIYHALIDDVAHAAVNSVGRRRP